MTRERTPNQITERLIVKAHSEEPKLSIYLLNNQLKNMWIPNFFIFFFFQIIMVREIRNYATLKVLYTVIDMLYFCFYNI